MSFHIEGVSMESVFPLSQRLGRRLFLFLIAAFLGIPASSRSQADDAVFAVAKEGCNVYIGGWFRNVAGIPADHIARWDGSTWSNMGNATAPVRALATRGSDVYAAGQFILIGGTFANHVAKWNGSTWSGLGSGTTGNVYALRVYGGDLYVGGTFGFAGAQPVNNIAMWDGTGWLPLGAGTGATVRAIDVSGTHVFVGGDFQFAGGVSAKHVAQWDGAAWLPLGSGVNGNVRAVRVLGDKVYVGGNFTNAGGTTALGLAVWDQTTETWSEVGGGLTSSSSIDPTVWSMTSIGTNLYIGGDFNGVGGISTRFLAAWNGTGWTTSATSTPLYAYTLWPDGSRVYVGGHTGNIRAWTGSAFATVESVGDCAPTGIREFLPHLDAELRQNHPNPFNPRTIIRYDLHSTGPVLLSVYDASGRLVRTLVDQLQHASDVPYQVVWDGEDAAGRRAASGVYFYRLRVRGGSQTKKMILLK